MRAYERTCGPPLCRCCMECTEIYDVIKYLCGQVKKKMNQHASDAPFDSSTKSDDLSLPSLQLTLLRFIFFSILFVASF